MIADWQTNLLYLADTLLVKYPNFCKSLENILVKHSVKYSFLPGTNDVWAVDFMPIQTDISRFVQFTYNPCYLQTQTLLPTISNVDEICSEIGVLTIKSDLVVDGGNVIKGTDIVIMTSRIFKDNSNYAKDELLTKLKELFEVDKLFIIPEQPFDFTGHADGMIRLLNDQTLLINEPNFLESPRFLASFRSAIKKTGLEYVQIPYNPYNNIHKDHAQGCYMNFLQLDGTVLVPIFGMKEDDLAIRKFEELYPSCAIVPILSNDIANDGGILNCISWNILSRDDCGVP